MSKQDEDFIVPYEVIIEFNAVGGMTERDKHKLEEELINTIAQTIYGHVNGFAWIQHHEEHEKIKVTIRPVLHFKGQPIGKKLKP